MKRKKLLFLLFALLISGAGGLRAGTYVDVTNQYLTNANMASDPKGNGWTLEDNGLGNNASTAYAGGGQEFYSTWGEPAGNAIGSTKICDLYQTVTLPAGEYRLTGHGFYREGGQTVDGQATEKAYLYAGAEKAYVNRLSTNIGNPTAAGGAFNGGQYPITLTFTLTGTTSVKIGYYCSINTLQSWCVVGAVKLEKLQYGYSDFQTAYSSAQTLYSQYKDDTTTKMCRTFVDHLGTLLTNYADYSASNTEAEFKTACKALDTAVADVNGSVKSYEILGTATNDMYGWATTNGNKLHLDTWANSASGFTVPFIENWIEPDLNTINAGVTTYTLRGLEKGYYQATFDLNIVSEKNNNIGGTFTIQENDSEVINVLSAGTSTTSPFKRIYGTFSLTGYVGDDGKFVMSATNANSTFNWVNYKNMKVEFLYTEKPAEASLGEEIEVNVQDGNFVQPGQQFTVNYPKASAGESGETLAITAGAKATVTINGTATQVTLTTKDNGFAFTFPEFAIGSAISVSIPAGVFGYTTSKNEAMTISSLRTPLVFDGYYYMKTAAGRFFSPGANYGTRAITDANFGYAVHITTDAAGMTKFAASTNGSAYLYNAGSEIYIDGGANNTWQLEDAGDGAFYIADKTGKGDGKYLYDENGLLVSSSGKTAFTLITLEAYRTFVQTREDGYAAEAATAAGYTGVTTAEGLAAHINGLMANREIVPNVIANDQTTAVEFYASANVSKSYTMAVEPGFYKVSVEAFYRVSDNAPTYEWHALGADDHGYALYAGDKMVMLGNWADAGLDAAGTGFVEFDGKYYPNTLAAAETMFNKGYHQVELYIYVPEATTLEYGFKGNGPERHWLPYRNIKLTKFNEPTESITASVSTENWMQHLPDGMYLAEVSLPGAHDAATGDGFTSTTINSVAAESNATTQDVDIAAQWNAGVRAFDLRPRVNDNADGLVINHGVCTTKRDFKDVLKQLIGYLNTNPTEFAVVHYRDEGRDYYNLVSGSSATILGIGNSKANAAAYPALLNAVLTDAEVAPYLVPFSRGLTVGDMRGKILMLSRDDNSEDNPIVGGVFKNWPGEDPKYDARVMGPGSGYALSPLYVQDNSTTIGEEATKVAQIREMLDKTTAQSGDDPSDFVFAFNFASAYNMVSDVKVIGITVMEDVSSSDGYRSNATYTNKAFVDYLEDVTHPAGPAGIVLMDYAVVDESNGYATMGGQLIQSLVNNNVRYIARMNEVLQPKLKTEVTALSDKLATLRTSAEALASEAARTAMLAKLADIETAIAAAPAAIDEAAAAKTLYPRSHNVVDEIEESINSLEAEIAMINSTDEQVDMTGKLGEWKGSQKPYTGSNPQCVEFYWDQHYVSEKLMWQRLTNLPNGRYTAQIYCNASHANINQNLVDDGDATCVHVKANNASVAVQVYNVNSVATPTLHTIENIEVTDGTLELYVGSSKKAANWFIVANSSLTYLGPDAATVNRPVGNTGFASFSSDKDLKLPEGVKAYGANMTTAENGSYVVKVHESAMNVIPANTGVIIEATPNTTLTFTEARYNYETEFDVENDLLATSAMEGKVPAAIGSYYGLAEYNDHAVFAKLKDGNSGSFAISGDKALLYLDDAAGAAKISILFDDETTGICEIRQDDSEKDGVAFNLAGQRVDARSYKGVIILNGKKYINK